MQQYFHPSVGIRGAVLPIFVAPKFSCA